MAITAFPPTQAQTPPAFAIAGQIAVAGGTAITAAGTTISIAPSGASTLIDGTWQSLQPAPMPIAPPPAAVFSAGGLALTSVQPGQLQIAGQTGSAGGPVITAGDTTISVATGASSVVVNGIAHSLSQQSSYVAHALAGPLAGSSRVPLEIASSHVTPNAQGDYVVAGQTLKPGVVATFAGMTVSVADDGASAIVNGVFQTLTSSRSSDTSAVPGVSRAPLRVGTATVAPNAQGEYVVAGQTIKPGVAATIPGTSVSLARDGSSAVVNGVVQTLALSSSANPLRLGATAVTPDSQGSYVVAGRTLTPGVPVTISGTVISLAYDGDFVVVGTNTQRLGPTGMTSTGNLMSSDRPPTTNQAASSNATSTPGILDGTAAVQPPTTSVRASAGASLTPSIMANAMTLAFVLLVTVALY